MYKPVQSCTNCGANLTLDDMRGDECPYCRTVYPHKSVAAQHQQVIHQQMNHLVAQQHQVQNQWRGAFGVGPQPPPGAPPGYGAPGHGGPGAYDPHAMLHHGMQQANATARGVQKIVMVSLIGTFALIAVITIAVFVLV